MMSLDQVQQLALVNLRDACPDDATICQDNQPPYQKSNLLTLYDVPETNLSTIDEHQSADTEAGFESDPCSKPKAVKKNSEKVQGTCISPNEIKVQHETFRSFHSSQNAALDINEVPSENVEPILSTLYKEEQMQHAQKVANTKLQKSSKMLYGNSQQLKNVEKISEKENLPQTSTADDKPTGQLISCEFCGKFGLKEDFKGRFCSKTCIGKNVSKYKQKSKSETLKRKLSIEPSSLERRSSVVTESGELKLKIRLPSPNPISKRANSNTEVKFFQSNRKFKWSDYLSNTSTSPVSIEPFEAITGQSPFPVNKNPFKVGWYLEAVDPIHQSIICLVSIVQIVGYRVRLHIEGYHDCYDFWVNADSPLIFPCGFCESTGRQLAPPKGYPGQDFDWKSYVNKRSEESPPNNFYFQNSASEIEFKIGDKLEAIDRQHPELICVATIADIIGDYLLIHFDGWGNDYDYWVRYTSLFIHPVGWCGENKKVLSPPLNYDSSSPFVWEEYIVEKKSRATPKTSFVPTIPVFECNKKLEVVDKRNPMLLRVATIAEVSEFNIQIHYDGWSQDYDEYFDVDSTDIHPVSWCSKTNHPLQPPPSFGVSWSRDTRIPCPTEGCNGLGHVNGPKALSYHQKHHSEYGCPYATQNLDRQWIYDRLLEQHHNRNSSNERPLTCSPSQSPDIVPSKRKKMVEINSKRIYHDYGARKRRDQLHLLKKKRYVWCHRGDMQRSMKVKKRRHLHIEHHHRHHKPHKTLTEYEPLLNPSRYEALNTFPLIHLPPYWLENVKFLSGVTDVKANEVKKWDSTQVASFIEQVTGKQEYGELFTREQIDGYALLLLNQGDISNVLKVKLGPAVKIYNALLFLKVMQRNLVI